MHKTGVIAVAMAATLAASVEPARAIERLCDPANDDCRTILINLIRNERVSIDVAFWFMGPVVYFATTGTQRIRIQQREDGISIDQIVLSPSTYINSSPGALKNDTRIMPRTQ